MRLRTRIWALGEMPWIVLANTQRSHEYHQYDGSMVSDSKSSASKVFARSGSTWTPVWRTIGGTKIGKTGAYKHSYSNCPIRRCAFARSLTKSTTWWARMRVRIPARERWMFLQDLNLVWEHGEGEEERDPLFALRDVSSWGKDRL
jgi:hypothetical protein